MTSSSNGNFLYLNTNVNNNNHNINNNGYTQSIEHLIVESSIESEESEDINTQLDKLIQIRKKNNTNNNIPTSNTTTKKQSSKHNINAIKHISTKKLNTNLIKLGVDQLKSAFVFIIRNAFFKALKQKENDDSIIDNNNDDISDNSNNINTTDVKEKISYIDQKRNKLITKKNAKGKLIERLEKDRIESENELELLRRGVEEQQQKLNRITEGNADEVSETESLSLSLTHNQNIKNGLEILSFCINNYNHILKLKAFSQLYLLYTTSTPSNSKPFIKKPPTKRFTVALDKLTLNNILHRKGSLFSIGDNDNNDNKLLRDYEGKDQRPKGLYKKYDFDNEIINEAHTEHDDALDFINKFKRSKNFREKKKRTTIKEIREEERRMLDQLREEHYTSSSDITEKDEHSKDDLSEENDPILNPDYGDNNTATEDGKNKLMEYDKFYKEMFFKDELFKMDHKFKDKEADEIKNEIEKLELKRKIQQKQKIRDVYHMKGLDTIKIDKEINKLKEEHKKKKTAPPEPIELQMNNTDGLLYKGRLLNNYFIEQHSSNIPKFTVQNERYIKGKEVIDFKPLHKEEQIRRMYDKCPCLKCRKTIYKGYVYVTYYCNLLVDNKIFEYFSLAIIVLNTIFILISDPRDPNSLANDSDSIFLYFYTVECVLKILGYGFILPERAYLRDEWNILDFFVIIIGWVSFILEHAMDGTTISGLAGLRAFRILRPLKTVKSIKGLKRLVTALLASIRKLGDISIVLFFFFLIFAIAGVQMWQGLFFRRCMSLQYGYMYSFSNDEAMCTFDSDCSEYNTPGNTFICAKGYRNPNNGITTFDNTLTGFMTIFIIATLEGWTTIWNYVSKTFKDKFYINPVIIFLYFHLFIFVGGFYLINLFLAVTNSEFTNVERLRKELTSKKSFFELVKSKYDLKEKEKQEKKRKEKELKLKSKRKLGENIYEIKEKIDDEAFYIEKNVKDIPMNYTTIKDMYILQNNHPEELYEIDKMIKDEKKFLKDDIKQQKKHIDKLFEEKKQKGRRYINTTSDDDEDDSILNDDIANISRQNTVKDKKSKLKRKDTQFVVFQPMDKIYKSAIGLAVNATEKYLKRELIALSKVPEKKRTESRDILRQKIEKKEMEKLNMQQISVMEDLSFEKEERMKYEAEVNERRKRRQTNLSDNSYNDNNRGNKGTVVIAKRIINDDGDNNGGVNISDELSFMTDLSLASKDDNNNNTNNELSYNISNDNSSFIANNNNHSASGISQLFTSKRIQLSDNNNIITETAFHHPRTLLPEILKLKNDAILNKKIEKIQNKFQIKDYLQKATSSLATASLGRRRSFLGFLQYSEDKNQFFDFINSESFNNSENLDITLSENNNNKDVISLSSRALSDISDVNSSFTADNIVLNDDMEIKEVSKNIQLNKLTTYSKQVFLDKTITKFPLNLAPKQVKHLFAKVNTEMNSNIVIDSKAPRGRELNNSKVSNMFMPFQFTFNKENVTTQQQQQRKDNKQIKTNDISIIKFKSKSIDKNAMKYPQQDTNKLIVEEHNKKNKDSLTPQQEQIGQNMRSKKYYMNYLYNIKEKDIQVKDTFKIDHWKHEILHTKNTDIPRKKLPESIEAVYVFNDKSLNLKKYTYLNNKNFTYLDEECAYLTHNLKSLPISILEIMPLRMRDFGKYAVGKEINLGTLGNNANNNAQGNTTSSLNLSKSGMAHTTTNINKQKTNTLGMCSSFSMGHKIQDDFKYKKGLYEKIYKRMDDFNYKTLSHYFLEENKLYLKLADDRHREEIQHEIEERNRNAKAMLEVKTEIKNIRVFDIRTNSSRYQTWSGQDVFYMYASPPGVVPSTEQEKRNKKYNEMISNLEEFGVIIWKRQPGIKQLQKVRYALYLLSINFWFDLAIMILVIINALIMALDGNLFTPETYANISLSNYVFNAIFIAEFIIKFIGLGPIVYFSDAFTYLDLLIIAFAIVDMISPADNSADSIGANKKLSSQLSFLRVFRIFRVLRLTKILRKMKSMRLIIVSIKKSLANVAYIILILIMFLLIFQLLGMSLLNGNMRYQSFMIAFYTTFQILTMENWNAVFYEIYPMSELTFFYFLIWIFLGNYILFNLFISILLQSFEDSDQMDEDDEDDNEKVERQFNLPDYLAQLKNIEVEHKNRLKNSNKQKNKKQNQQQYYSGGRNNKSGLRSSKVHSTLNASSSRINISGSYLSGTNSSITESNIYESNTNENEDEDDMNTVTGIDKNIKHWQKVNVLFRKNECEISLYIFSQVNTFRICCMKIISNKAFDMFILAIILLSTARLILDTFIAGYTSVFVFDMVDLGFNIIFLIEMVLKVISLGFVFDEGSYLRDNWNKIDFIIVLVSLIDIQSYVEKYINNTPTSNSMNFLKVLRLLRTLRPLRFISHNVQLKLIIVSLFDSILPIINALCIVLIVLFMFSIVGINLFANLYHNCYVPGVDSAFKIADTSFADYLIEYEIGNNMPEISSFCADRYNGIMDTGPKFKFSNIFSSLVTAYTLGSMEGWPEIMNDYRVFNDYYGLFFVVYILIVSYFFLNIFTGIMFKYFNDAWSKEKRVGDDDKKAQKYYDFIQQIEETDPEYTIYLSPEPGSAKYYLITIANSKFLDNFIMVIIFLNLIIMAINFDGTDPTYQKFLDIANLIFTSIFIVECVLKIIALGPCGYFYFGWNRFDFFVVVASIADLIIANIDGINASFLKSFQIIRVLRVLRVTRVLRLIKALKSLEKLLQTLRWSVNALANVFILMFLIFCIFAILGCYLYEVIMYEDYKDEIRYMNIFYNFDNFYNAFLLCFRCSTGEDWPSIMLELAFIDDTYVQDYQAYLYMIIMHFITTVIMLNLFLMVTLQQYDEFTGKSYNPVEMYENFVEEYKAAWNKYSSSKDDGFRMKKILVTNFFVEFNWKKLNFPEQNRLEHIKKYVTDLDLISDQENYIYFHDVLLKIVAKQMGSKVDRTLSSNAVLFREEKKVSDAVKKKIAKYIEKKKINKDKLQNPLSNFNPLTSHLYFKISFLYFKTFIRFYNENAEMIQNEEYAEFEAKQGKDSEGDDKSGSIGIGMKDSVNDSKDQAENESSYEEEEEEEDDDDEDNNSNNSNDDEYNSKRSNYSERSTEKNRETERLIK